MNNAATQSLAESWSEQLRAAHAPQGPAWLTELHERAVAEFAAGGLPHRKVEAWKYTPVSLLTESAPMLSGAAAGTTEFPGPLVEDAAVLDFSDGVLSGSSPQLAEGVSLLSMPQAMELFEGRIRGLSESVEMSGPDRAFAALNTAFMQQGYVLHVAAGVDAGRLLFRWASSAGSSTLFAQARIVFLLDSGSKLELIEQYQSSPGDSGALNVMLQAELGEGACFDHIRVQQEPDQRVLLTSLAVQQAAGSKYSGCGFDLGGGLVRHESSSVLAGKEAHADMAGAFVLDGRRHVDNHVSIEHAALDCSSEQFFRGVLGGRSRGVFNGRALIRPGADGSSVVQSNANLLLSRLAEIDTKPELEIYADEVEASHGATVGQLDESAVFYLRTRGLDEEQARRMLTAAFCHAVSNRLGDRALAETIAAMLDTAMPAGEL